MVRYNIDDPKVMAAFLRSGSIWSIKQFWPKAIDAVQKGLVPVAECKDVPPEVMPYLNKR